MNYFYANRKDKKNMSKILCFISYFEEFLNSPEAISQHLCVQICKHPWVYLSRLDQCFFLLNHPKSTWQHLCVQTYKHKLMQFVHQHLLHSNQFFFVWMIQDQFDNICVSITASKHKCSPSIYISCIQLNVSFKMV